MHQLMGNLPAPRVRMSRPFSHTGVDYAGPIEIKAWKGRNAKTLKGYFSIFVCMATKAVHIEVVSDLTTQAFIAAFRRFTARRGLCTAIYSDCGTNFVGANTELQKLLTAAQFDWKACAESIANDGTKWNFNPPASPHFGGLWEAGVKSIKFHLKRVAGNQVLTYEELNTLLTQIEACLNSRPLCPVSEDIDDLQALTPSHFLIGEPLVTPPQPEYGPEKVSHLDRWKRVQGLLQSFWRKWSNEYLARLQQRPKWTQIETQQLKEGDLVLLKDEKLPPAKWSLARVVKLHTGSDNLTRIATVRTHNSSKGREFKSPITKICPLPTNTTGENTIT